MVAKESMRRMSSSATPDTQAIQNITNLPEALLENVGSFLARPSRAMFAVAVTARSSSWCNALENNEKDQLTPASSAILEHEQWDVLDFEDIERSLASRLSDEDLAAMLLCLGSGKKLTRLKLAGCIEISGRGMEPLRGSVTLEQIDLSMVGQHELAGTNTPTPKITEEAILSILTSIVEQPDSSLSQIRFPKKWCAYWNRSAAMNQFLHRNSSDYGEKCCDKIR